MGAITEIFCREASGKYCQTSGLLAELQEEVEEVVEALQELRSLLAGIEEVSCSKQRANCRVVRERELRDVWQK